MKGVISNVFPVYLGFNILSVPKSDSVQLQFKITIVLLT